MSFSLNLFSAKCHNYGEVVVRGLLLIFLFIYYPLTEFHPPDNTSDSPPSIVEDSRTYTSHYHAS